MRFEPYKPKQQFVGIYSNRSVTCAFCQTQHEWRERFRNHLNTLHDLQIERHALNSCECTTCNISIMGKLPIMHMLPDSPDESAKCDGCQTNTFHCKEYLKGS